MNQMSHVCGLDHTYAPSCSDTNLTGSKEWLGDIQKL